MRQTTVSNPFFFHPACLFLSSCLHPAISLVSETHIKPCANNWCLGTDQTILATINGFTRVKHRLKVGNTGRWPVSSYGGLARPRERERREIERLAVPSSVL